MNYIHINTLPRRIKSNRPDSYREVLPTSYKNFVTPATKYDNDTTFGYL